MNLARAIGLSTPLLVLPAWGASQEPPREHGQFAEVNGARIYFEDQGEGVPLFLLHAYFGTASRWDSYVDELRAQYRVIAWDMRGHGRSTSPTRSDVFLHEDVARDLLGLMDHLEIRRARAVGASSGAITLLYAATLEPDRFEAIALVGGITYRTSEAREYFARPPFLEDPASREQLTRVHGEERFQQLARQVRRLSTVYGDPAFTPDLLATISARTLIIQGDNDHVASLHQAVEMFSAIPRSHLWITPQGGHFPHLLPQNRDDFLLRVGEFLAGQWEEGER